jgi:hypothetical protein
MPNISRRNGPADIRSSGAADARSDVPLTLSLARLDSCRVAVHIVIQGREQFVRGLAAYEADQDLGNALRVHVSDPHGDFEVVVAESCWDGKILPGQAVGCDYLIRLH